MRSSLLLSLGTLLLTVACAATPTSAPPASGAGTVRSDVAALAASGATATAPTALSIPQPPERARMSFAGQNAQFATAWVAKDAGLFHKYGIDADVKFLPSRQASAALISGDVDYGFFSGRTVVELRTQGADVVAVALPIRKLIQSVVVTPAIQQPADLKGKRL